MRFDGHSTLIYRQTKLWGWCDTGGGAWGLDSVRATLHTNPVTHLLTMKLNPHNEPLKHHNQLYWFQLHGRKPHLFIYSSRRLRVRFTAPLFFFYDFFMNHEVLHGTILWCSVTVAARKNCFMVSRRQPAGPKVHLYDNSRCVWVTAREATANTLYTTIPSLQQVGDTTWPHHTILHHSLTLNTHHSNLSLTHHMTWPNRRTR